MNFFRVIFSICFFIIGTYLLIDLFITEFAWSVLGGSFVAYLVSYWFWPSEYTSRGSSDSSNWHYFGDFIELPINIILYPLRAIGRFLRNIDCDCSGGDGFDFFD